ncbi:hypothetical protein CW732_07205 [Olleya sp. Bg11-27]|nr:hypothetical protein CW732_07205 [Olleya sp. Bg11-27]
MSVFNVHSKYNLQIFLIIKKLQNLGKKSSKTEQKIIIGGGKPKLLRQPDFCDTLTEISREECFCLYFSRCDSDNL